MRTFEDHDHKNRALEMTAVILDSVGNFNLVTGSQSIGEEMELKHPDVVRTIRRDKFKGNFLLGRSRKADKDEKLARIYKNSLSGSGTFESITL